MITFHVPGPPRAWQRTALVNGRYVKAKAQREYQARMAHLFMCARAAKSWSTKERYRVTMEVTRDDARRSDLDNHFKQCDSLNKLAWDDDSQIDEVIIRRMPPSKTAPGLKVTIEVINAGGEHG